MIVDAAIGIEDFVTAHLRGLPGMIVASLMRGIDLRHPADGCSRSRAANALRDQMRPDDAQLLGDAGNADVPAAGQFALGHAEIAERAGIRHDRR